MKHVTREGDRLIIHMFGLRKNKLDILKKEMRMINATFDSLTNTYSIPYTNDCWKYFEARDFVIPDYVRENCTLRRYTLRKLSRVNIPESYTKGLFKYQVDGLKMLQAGYSYLADGCGLGKTVESLKFLELNHKNISVIIAPSYMKEKWQKELKQWTDLKSQIVYGTNEVDFSEDCVYIINYDILSYHTSALLKRKIDILLCDESHFCCNGSSDRTKQVGKLSHNSGRTIAISGTPFLKTPNEMYPMLHLLYPLEFYSPVLFEQRYSITKSIDCGGFNKKLNVDSKNEEELYQRLKSSMMIRRLVKNVKEDLGNFKTEVIQEAIKIKLKDKKEYAKAKNSILIDRLQKPRILKDIIYENKKEEIFKWVENFLKDNQKICLYFTSTSHLNEFMKRFKEYNPLKINGETPTNKRFKMCDDFNNDPSIRMLCGNIKACGTGLDLFGSHTTGFVDLDWNYSNMKQVIKREDRIGQKSPFVDVYYFVGEDTIESEYIFDKLDNRNRQFLKIIDGRDLKRNESFKNNFNN